MVASKEEMEIYQLHNELKGKAGKKISADLLKRIQATDNHTIKVINEKPYNKEGYVLADVYLNYCYSHPVPVYVKK